MKHLILGILLGSTALMPMTAGAQQAQPDRTPQVQDRQVQDRQLSAAQQSFVWVTPARQIIGQDLLPEQELDGIVSFLMIDVDRANVLYALVSVGAVGQYAAVPWEAVGASALEAFRDGDLRLSVPEDTIRNARRFEMDDISRMTTPPVATETTETFAVEVLPPAADSPVLVLGREVVGTVSSPLAQVANQLQGSMVVDAEGTPIGEISEIMTDMRAGRVPYVLVSTGGFLGTGETYVPVPPQALQWQADGAQYSVDITAAEIEELPRLTGNPLQVYIRRSDLEQLYSFFDVDP